MKTFSAFLAGMLITLVIFIPCAGIRENHYREIINLQDSLIEKAQDELEYHIGDYGFMDGSEPAFIEELKEKL